MEIKNVNLGQEIAKLIIERGMTKAQLADSIGVKRQNINRDVLDKKSLDSQLIARISEKLDYNLFSLFISNNQNDCNKKRQVNAKIIIEIGAEKQEKSATFIFGQNKVELK